MLLYFIVIRLHLLLLLALSQTDNHLISMMKIEALSTSASASESESGKWIEKRRKQKTGGWHGALLVIKRHSRYKFLVFNNLVWLLVIFGELFCWGSMTFRGRHTLVASRW